MSSICSAIIAWLSNSLDRQLEVSLPCLSLWIGFDWRTENGDDSQWRSPFERLKVDPWTRMMLEISFPQIASHRRSNLVARGRCRGPMYLGHCYLLERFQTARPALAFLGRKRTLRFLQLHFSFHVLRPKFLELRATLECPEGRLLRWTKNYSPVARMSRYVHPYREHRIVLRTRARPPRDCLPTYIQPLSIVVVAR